jgi:hypothetical protein
LLWSGLSKRKNDRVEMAVVNNMNAGNAIGELNTDFEYPSSVIISAVNI